jgi:hypothetical protein
MSNTVDNEQVSSLEELVVSHSFEMLALITVLERKGILTRQEVVGVIKEIQNGLSES